MTDSKQAIGRPEAGCGIIERADLGHVNLRGQINDANFAKSVKKVTGLDLPSKPNTMSMNESSAAARIYWLGPDEWQIVVAKSRARQLATELEESLGRQHAAVNDLSAGYVTFELSGAGVTAMLAKGSTLDFRADRFGTGCCAQTTLAKSNVLLGAIAAGARYELVVRRSFADYLRRWLEYANAG